MIIVEDGSGKYNSNSYVSVEYADKYFTDTNNNKWLELPNEEKESALIKSTQFIDVVFNWKGKKKTYKQALNFPRIDLVDKDGYIVEGIPKSLMIAVCEGAFISSSGKSLFINEESNGNIVSEKIGELSFTYDTATKIHDRTIYSNINALLRGLYIDTSVNCISTSKVERV